MRGLKVSAWWGDALLAIGVATLGAAGGAATSPGMAGWVNSPGRVALEAVCGLALALRRRHPVPLAVAVIAASLFGGVPFALPFAVYNLAVHVRDPRVVWPLAAVATAVAAGPGRPDGWPATSPPQLVAEALFIGCAPLLLGLYVRARRDLAEREARGQVDRARTEERARLAREMHDVVTHRVSLMVLQAGSLRMLAGQVDGEEVRAVAEQIRATGAQALDELRAVVGVLRAGNPVEAAPLTPQPDLPDLDTLVRESRAVGVPVELRVTGEAPDLPPPLGRTAYRIVQEALTNARKHAYGAPVTVDVAYSEQRVVLRVRNAAPPGRRPAEPLPGGGAGLLGLRERVTLLGGALRAGPTASGGFEVGAELPLPAGAA
uniref:sensor histidine kinase n=1 Tax=Nonomuraea pusilla TaxID=46177 RepID=UPI0006E2F9C3|nr:histidine kinase [Nonomuraea pusilla]